MSKLSKDDLLHVARLARLKIPEAQLATMEKQFNEIVGYVEKLNELKTDGIEPTTQVISNPNQLGTPLAADAPEPSFSKDDVVANAPDRQDQLFKVPRVIGEET
jgi:aspartyl-tRNA(Asn)/glutamyl-tRNA(Gln) amidotransferase subunit C